MTPAEKEKRNIKLEEKRQFIMDRIADHQTGRVIVSQIFI